MGVPFSYYSYLYSLYMYDNSSSDVSEVSNLNKSKGGPVVKNPRAMQETREAQVLSLGQEDSLEKEMATHSSILAWETPWTEEPGRLQPMGSQRVVHDQYVCACMHMPTRVCVRAPVVRILRFHHQGPGFNPWSGN